MTLRFPPGTYLLEVQLNGSPYEERYITQALDRTSADFNDVPTQLATLLDCSESEDGLEKGRAYWILVDARPLTDEEAVLWRLTGEIPKW